MSDEKHGDEKHVDFGSSSVVSPAADAKKAALPKAPQVKPKDVTLSEPILQKVNMFFKKLDSDGNGSISREEALAFWKKNFARLNASAMFKEVDQDGNGEVDVDEWILFWKNVIAHGYDEDELIEEIDMMMEGDAWVDFDDGRQT